MMYFHMDFKPLIKSAYYQTVIGTAIDFELELSSRTHYVKLADGDIIAAEISTPKGWKKTDSTVVLVHGLCGSHRSHYMKRIGRRMVRCGARAVRINLRGCGTGRGLARGIYHSGCSLDVEAVVRDLKRLTPESRIVLGGFSLGANVVLKLAGELRDEGEKLLAGTIAVSPPVDLLSSARLFMRKENQVYARYFLRLLMHDVNFIHSHFSDLPPHNLPPFLTLNDFDELYVAPRAHFSSALEYYHRCSAKNVIPNIDVATKILFAKDDPIICESSIDVLRLPPKVHVYKTEHGGHIGFLGRDFFKKFRWMDHVFEMWACEMLGLVKGNNSER
ncbi:MAG: hypothetical protein A3F09_01680 [Chlamydiae bacterium RIFCSPHIGHO2_12_FULL_49_11]|nr:MAG: hypothetical protein A3F09_01680 [Chlamydiae bacterium RIFCSPHIGHO2_12_FULL_49_11]